MTFINTVTLKNDTNKVIHRVKSSGETIIVTQHGHPAVAIIPLDESDLVIKNERKFHKAIEQGLADIRKGKKTSLRGFVEKHFR